MNKEKVFSARNITYFAILLALVVVLQTTLGSIKIGATSFSVVLIPIVVGSILLGPIAGGILGFVFGLIVLIYGITGADAFTNVLFNGAPIMTILTCIVKGVVAGFVPGLLYKLLAPKNQTLATIVSALVAPILNTGLFILGALCMSGVISNNFVADGQTVIYFLVIVCAGINFLVEFAVNAVVSPGLARVVQVIEKRVK